MFSGSLCGFVAVRRYWSEREMACLPCENKRQHFYSKLRAQAQDGLLPHTEQGCQSYCMYLPVVLNKIHVEWKSS